MPGQIDYSPAQTKEAIDPGVIEVEPSLAKIVIEGVVRSAPFPGTRSRGKSGERVWIETQDLPHFACCQFRAIGNDIGSHSSPVLAVALVNILNHAFAFISARQVKINFRPFS